MIQIAVIGDSEADEKSQELAEEVGRLLAENGVVVLSGGRGGVMEATFKGVKNGNGTTVGILPSGDKSEANPYTDITIVTNNTTYTKLARQDRAISPKSTTLSLIED